MITETEYYNMTAAQRDEWVCRHLLELDEQDNGDGTCSFWSEDDGSWLWPPDHRDDNTVMAVIEKVECVNSTLEKNKRGDGYAWWCCFVLDHEDDASWFVASADELHDAVYLAAGRALGEVT